MNEIFAIGIYDKIKYTTRRLQYYYKRVDTSNRFIHLHILVYLIYAHNYTRPTLSIDTIFFFAKRVYYKFKYFRRGSGCPDGYYNRYICIIQVYRYTVDTGIGRYYRY